ncbi:MAG TPA: hypothetical protein VGM02_12005 [Acidobacteriaceae bacterium]|jgi:hypothetical protein
MKRSRLIFAAAFTFVVFVIPANSCGPFFPEALFVQNSMPDGIYAAYAKGEIGVPQPGYRVQDLVVAFDWLNGHGLTADEQQQAVALDRIQTTREYQDPAKLPGFVAWLAARKDSGVPEPPPPPPQSGFHITQELNSDRPVPGASYQNFTNCLDPAFATAADTLKDRKTAHANDSASFADWVHGQDAVFANCNGSGDKMPADAASNAPEWLKQDRAYQQAAAKFYQTDYDAAITRLKTIVVDTSSPWHLIARLVEARAMIRRATIGQITDIPAAAVAAPDAPYSEEREKAQRAYQNLVKQKEFERLGYPLNALLAIIGDPIMQQYHADAAGLLDFVKLRLEPRVQAEVLAARLTDPDRAQTPGHFQQAIIDLRYYLYPPYSRQRSPAATKSTSPSAPLFTWMQAMRAPAPVQETGWSDQTPDPAKVQQERAQAATEALGRWRSTHATLWLIGAMANAQPGDPAAAELIQAAMQIPQTSPAWTAATYNRLRLTEDPATMRGDLAVIEPSLVHTPQRSTINLFKLLNQRVSPTLADFLHQAAALPAGITTFDSGYPDAPDTKPDPNSLCGVNGSEASTLLFNPDAATILNTRMPLTLLVEAAEDKALPRNLSFQIAQSTWTRAILLNRPEIARRMSPILTGCYPAWKPWLESYDSAKTADNRHAAGLLALMRFPSTEPLVRAGMQRSDGFATYSQFRDNWWSASDTAQPASPGNPSGRAATFFGTQPATPAALPDPPFLTEADRARAQREIAALRATTCASDYFAAAALDWQKQHPADPRNVALLGFAERAIRNGCRTDATKELNHRLFVIVQTKYPKSEWAKKYTTWE